MIFLQNKALLPPMLVLACGFYEICWKSIP
jgi:hypothetical protein